ncbi:unnamed protein product [Effrenium voratum]|uniref:Uncharacterized protein n=1 Tax=Effrenium voratum TaxID=2562239 RepID=A0AA36N308_9DINO|nr:unnamed protein product [Effrenium voratum]
MSDGMFDFCDMPVVIFEGLLLGRQLRFWAAAEAELPFPAKALCEVRRLRHEDFDEDLLLNSMCGSVFDTVQLLCEHLSTLPPPRRALELGAGVGLPGLWLASGSPARVVLSDCQPGVLRLLAENVELNDLQGRAVAQRLRWGEEVEDSFDLVLGSDILYDASAASGLFATAAAAMAPEGRFVLANTIRGPSVGVKVILQHAAASGLRWVNSCDLGALQQSEAYVFVFEKDKLRDQKRPIGMDAKPNSTTRGQLPGIPSSIDRVSAECIWKSFCTSSGPSLGAASWEVDYVRQRKLQPAQPRRKLSSGGEKDLGYGQHQISNLHGFEVARAPSEVRNASYMSVRRAKPSAFLEEPKRRAGGVGGARFLSGEGRAAAKSRLGQVTPDRPPMVLPKYQRFSGDHMLPLEMNPMGSETGFAKFDRKILTVLILDSGPAAVCLALLTGLLVMLLFWFETLPGIDLGFRDSIGRTLARVISMPNEAEDAQNNFNERYVKSYLPPGDDQYTDKWVGGNSSWRSYMSQYGAAGDYQKFLKQYGGPQANYDQYVSLYSSMAGPGVTSGDNYKVSLLSGAARTLSCPQEASAREIRGLAEALFGAPRLRLFLDSAEAEELQDTCAAKDLAGRSLFAVAQSEPEWCTNKRFYKGYAHGRHCGKEEDSWDITIEVLKGGDFIYTKKDHSHDAECGFRFDKHTKAEGKWHCSWDEKKQDEVLVLTGRATTREVQDVRRYSDFEDEDEEEGEEEGEDMQSFDRRPAPRISSTPSPRRSC